MQPKTFIFKIGKETFQLDFKCKNRTVKGFDCHTCWHLYRTEDVDFYGPLNHFIAEVDISYAEYLGFDKKPAKKDSIRDFVVLDDTSKLSPIEKAAISAAIKLIKK